MLATMNRKYMLEYITLSEKYLNTHKWKLYCKTLVKNSTVNTANRSWRFLMALNYDIYHKKNCHFCSN